MALLGGWPLVRGISTCQICGDVRDVACLIGEWTVGLKPLYTLYTCNNLLHVLQEKI